MGPCPASLPTKAKYLGTLGTQVPFFYCSEMELPIPPQSSTPIGSISWSSYIFALPLQCSPFTEIAKRKEEKKERNGKSFISNPGSQLMLLRDNGGLASIYLCFNTT